MEIETKDGIVLRNIPEGTPDDVIKARVEAIRAQGAPAPQTQGNDLLKSAGSGVVKGARDLGSMLTQLMEGGANANARFGMSTPFGSEKIIPQEQMPVRETLTAPLQNAANAAGANYEPSTTAGHYTKSIAEQVPAYAVGPGSLGLKAIGATGAGIGAEVGERTLGGPAGRFVGGFGGGLIAPTVAATVKNSSEMLADAVKNISSSEFANAKGMKDILTKIGLPNLNSQLFLSPTTLPALVERISQHPDVGPEIMRFMSRLPEQTRAALETRMMKLAPTGGRQDALDSAQVASGQAIKNEMKAAGKEYEIGAPGAFKFAPDRTEDLHNSIMDLAKKTGGADGAILKRKASELKDDQGNWITDSDTISSLYKQMNANYPELGSLSASSYGKMKDAFKAATPEFQPARDLYQQYKQAIVEPMQKSLTGQVATAGGGQVADKVTQNERILNLVFPKDKAQPERIRALAQDMKNGGDPEALAGVTREYITKAMETTLSPGNSKFNFKAPGDLATAVFGTNAQRVNLDAAIGEIAKANGMKAAPVQKGFKNFFEALGTYKDVRLSDNISSVDVARTAGKNLASTAISPFSRVSRKLEDFVQAKNYKRIADVMMSPDGVKKLEELSKLSPYSKAAQLIMTDIVSQATQLENSKNPESN